MDDQTFPANPPDQSQGHQAEPPQSSWPPPVPPPPMYPPNQAQPPYPQAPPPSQPMYPPYGQPSPSYGPPSYGPPSYGPLGQPYPPTNPPYSGYGQPQPQTNPLYPGYAAPSRPLYPPIGQPPQQPPRRGLKAWQWALIGVSGVLILCCVFGVIGSALGGSTVAGPVPTDTLAPTDTPQPTATPVPPGVGDHMALGHNYTQDTNGFYITQPADKFSYSSEFAFVVNLDQGIGTTQAKMALVKEEAGGAESVVDSVPFNIANPDYAQFANKFPTHDLMFGNSPGKYKLELQTDSAVIASGLHPIYRTTGQGNSSVDNAQAASNSTGGR